MRVVNRLGEIHKTKEGYNIVIVKFNGVNDCDVQFEDGLISYSKQYGAIKRGQIAYPYHKSVYDTGYLGVGEYKPLFNGKSTKLYQLWTSMLNRCYNPKCHELQPTYIGCSVHPDWHNFQVFAKWVEEKYIEGYALDKDLLVRGNKIYSAETCVFIPTEVNTLFNTNKAQRGDLPIGMHRFRNKFRVTIYKNKLNYHIGNFDTITEAFNAYKLEKEKYIKEVADKYKENLEEKVYQAMYNYTIEITS